MKLQFHRLHPLTWILSIKMRTFGACGGVRTHPVHPPWLRACPRKESIFVVCLVSEVSVFWRLVKTKRNMKRFFEFTKFRCYLGQGTAIRRVLQLVAREGKLELTWFLAMFLIWEAAVTIVLLQVRLELTRVFNIGMLMILKTWHCNIICANVPQSFHRLIYKIDRTLKFVKTLC